MEKLQLNRMNRNVKRIAGATLSTVLLAACGSGDAVSLPSEKPNVLVEAYLNNNDSDTERVFLTGGGMIIRRALADDLPNDALVVCVKGEGEGEGDAFISTFAVSPTISYFDNRIEGYKACSDGKFTPEDFAN